MTPSAFETLIEKIRTGDADAIVESCDAVLMSWQVAPVEDLLLLKEQFRKLDMEHREAHVEELLVSIAEKRPEPFTAIASDPDHPLWRPAIETLSLLPGNDYLELFISLVPHCRPREIKELVKAIGCYRCGRSAETLGRLLATEDDEVFMEAVLALKWCGGPEAAGPLRAALERKRREGSDMAQVVEAVLMELEPGAKPA